MSLLHRSLHIAGRQVTNISALIVVTILVCVGLAYWLSTAIAERKDEIAAWASQQTGYPIQLGEAGLYWFDLFPKLLVTDIRVLQAEPDIGELFTAEELYIGLDLIATLQQRQLVVDSARLSGLQIGVQRSTDGSISVIGMQGESAVSGLDNLHIDWVAELQSWRDIEILQATVQLDDQVQPQLSGVYQVNQLALVEGETTQLIGDIQLPHHLGEQLQFTIDAQLTSAGIASWQVRRLDARQLQLAALLQQQQISDIGVNRGQADVLIEATALARKRWHGEIQLTDIQLTALNRPEPSSLNLDVLSARFNWQGDNSAWQLDANLPQLSIEDDSWPQSTLKVQFSDVDGWEVESSFLRLSDITMLALLGDSAPAILTQYQPAGDIRHLHLTLDNDYVPQSIKIQVDDFASQPFEEIPGVAGLNLQLEWEPNSAQMLINSRNLTLFAPAWLPETTYFDVVEANLQWLQSEQGWQLQLNEMNIWNNDLTVRGELGLLQQAESLRADIDLQLLDVAVANWLSYVPRKVLDPNYLKWAENAYTAGQIETGSIKLKGNLADFPFDTEHADNQFEVVLNVADVGLNYGRGWPVLENIDGQVRSSGNTLDILPRSGRIAGFDFVDVTAVIQNIYAGQPRLDLTGLLSGRTQDALNFLEASPLGPRYGDITDWVKAQGNSNIALTLDIPLMNPDATEVQGHVSFENSQLTISALPDVPIKQVQGQLFFSNDGVNAETISAQIFDKSTRIDVTPQADATLVTATGELDSQQLSSLWEKPSLDFIQGATPYQLEVAIREKAMGQFETNIQVTSELMGLSIDAPSPLGKTAMQSRPLRVQLEQDAEQNTVLQLNYDDTLNSIWQFEEGARGEITIGLAEAVLPTSGIHVRGHLNELSVSQWKEWQQKWLSDWSNNATDKNWPPIQITLAVDNLQFNQWMLNDVQSTISQRNQTWQMDIQSRQLKGNIRWPVDSELLPTLHFDFVDLQLPVTENASAGRKKTSPALWPSFQLNIDSLTIDGMQLGRVQARALQQQDRWVLENASLQSAVLQAKLDGIWHKTPQSDESQLNLQLTSNDLAGLFVDLGYQPAIQANQVEVNGQFSWPDAPLQLSLAQLVGTMRLQVGNGQLVDVEPGAAGRIFGLMSFAAIPRRLSLDFSDFFGKGFAFRDITGDFEFANGLAVTNNLKMRGESATIDVSGPINIVDRTYHQTVVVTPNVSSTLPLAGAVAGGPVGLGVGTAIYLVDRIAGRLFERDLVDMISYRYRLTGPWDEPDLTLNRPESP